MACKRAAKPRSFFEPWTSSQSPSVGKEPNVEGLPTDAAASILDGWHRAKKNAPWLIWGSGMTAPTIATGYLSGKPVVMDDRQIIAVRKPTTDKEDAPTAEEIATRIATCVTAMAGIADPVAFIVDVRALLNSYSSRSEEHDPYEDLRFVRLLCLCVPLDELEIYE